jgi:hypothetical protein
MGGQFKKDTRGQAVMDEETLTAVTQANAHALL